MTDPLLTAIAARLENATPGGWHVGPHYRCDVESREGRIAECRPFGSPRAERNADFIAHAPEDIAYLLKALDAARARATRAEQELKEVSEALDWWAPLDAGEVKPLAQRIRDEGHDFGVLCDHLSETYDHFTGGQVSKPMTLPHVVFALADDIMSRDVDEAVREECEPLREQLAAETARADRLHGELETIRAEPRT